MSIIEQLSGTAAQRHAHLSEMVTVPSGRGLLDNSKFGDLVTPEAADQLYDIIKASTESYAIQYVTKGIDTSTTKWKERVDDIDTSNNAELAALKPLIRDWELQQVTRWASLGGTGEVPSVEAITAEMVAITCRSVISTTQSKLTTINGWLSTYDVTGKTPEQVQAYCDLLLASEDGNPPGDEE